MKVTAILVSHNGARWLPAVLGGLAASTRKVDAIVAVDTGSQDDSVALVERATGASVLRLDPRTPYAESVRAALESAAPAEPDEWVWLLHDDSNPAPQCLETLVATAADAPADVAVLGPKHREWPSLKRLLEVGVTLTGTGQRETGLERGEYDQGQHDEPHRVLAVNTAGMLVRRTVLESVGLDRYLPVFGTDLDFGWRVARAGYSTRVVPDAVVFHVEASRQDRRDSELVEHPGRQEREGAQYTLLVNSPGWTIPFRSARMILGGLLRALGLLLVRAPGEAADEVAALLKIFLRPRRVLRARRERAGTATVSHAEIRPLLAPFWLPYRHGLDYVTDVGVAIATSVREEAAKRRPPGVTDETPFWERVVRTPAVWVLLVALVAGRSYLGGEPLHGGALLPVPDSVSHWWQAWGSWQSDLGIGTHAAGPAYLLPLALLGTLLFGQLGLVVQLIFLLAVPVAFVGALYLLRRLCDGDGAPLWGAATYAMLPVVSGALAQGRLGTVVGAAVLPWLVAAALGIGAGAADANAEDDPKAAVKRWRAAWRAALLAWLLVAFVPPAWLVIALLALFALVGGFAEGRRRELAIVTLVPLVISLPWVLGTLRAPSAWLVEAGRAATLPADPGFFELVLGRTGSTFEAPALFAIGLPLAAVVAFLRSDTRARVLQVWVVVLAAAVVLAASSRVPVTLPGVPFEFRPWPGFLLLLVQAGFVAIAAIAGDGALKQVRGASIGWRQPVAVVTVAVAMAVPVLSAGWWLARGSDDLLDHAPSAEIPMYQQELAAGNDDNGVLRITGGLDRGIDYRVLRSGVERLGDDGVLAMTKPDPEFSKLVERLLSDARSGDVPLLATYGVKYVYAPPPVAGVVSGGMDAASGLGGASGPAQGSRAWVVQQDTSLSSVDDSRAWLRPVWVMVALIALLTTAVLAAPERRRRR